MNRKWFSSKLTEKSLYWEPPVEDARGNYTWKEPWELDTRWENQRKAIRYDLNGSEIIANSVIWTSNPYVLIGGYIMKGDLYFQQDLRKPPLDMPYDVNEGLSVSQEYAREIIDVESIPSVYDINFSSVKIWVR